MYVNRSTPTNGSVKHLDRTSVKTLPYDQSHTMASKTHRAFTLAGPEYEVKYDSKYTKPATHLGSFDRNKRVIKIGTTSYYDQHEAPVVRSPKRGGVGEQMSVYELRCSLVPLPKLKTRRPEQLVFNASSYNTAKAKEPLDLHPNSIDKVASVHLFDGLVAIPRKHVSVGFSSPPTKTF
eukprot:gene22822-28995_t